MAFNKEQFIADLEAKRACVGFEVSENSLQISDEMGISDAVLKHCINLYSNSE